MAQHQSMQHGQPHCCYYLAMSSYCAAIASIWIHVYSIGRHMVESGSSMICKPRLSLSLCSQLSPISPPTSHADHGYADLPLNTGCEEQLCVSGEEKDVGCTHIMQFRRAHPDSRTCPSRRKQHRHKVAQASRRCIPYYIRVSSSAS